VWLGLLTIGTTQGERYAGDVVWQPPSGDTFLLQKELQDYPNWMQRNQTILLKYFSSW
jgi:hypothetical protein